MQLSKLEIKGFKSFGDKVTIHFDQGITGIVGPNGCGKSNVVDAIRWVLGEQKTRNLRSDKMESVIFNGTRDRKQLQMAEVSITFKNTRNLLPTEYSEVTVTRRYYRTGDSEYLLNGVNCRLKDINDLFMDTGIGPDSYAIIELRMVDDILNDKNDSRRQLFEEAAGISKFKIRKKQTLKKLEDTDGDLSRVEDLLFEIEKNLKALEKQAKQAEKYFIIKEEYKKLSILLAQIIIKRHKLGFEHLVKAIEEESDKRTTVVTQVAEKQSLYEKHKLEIITKEKLLSSRQKTLNEHFGNIRQYESEKKIKNERLRFLTEKSNNLTNQLDTDKKSNDRAEFSIKSLNEEKGSLEKQLLEQESKVGQLRADYEDQKRSSSTLQEQVSSISAQLKSKETANYQLVKSLEINQVQLSSMKMQLEQTASESSDQNASIQNFSDKLKELTEELEFKKADLEAVQKKESEQVQELQLTNKQIDEIRENLNKNTRKLDASQHEYNLTKSMVENLEGFPDAVKFLRKNADWAKHTPLLSDILTCDEKYRVAVENFLDPYMNYYVVKNEEQAYQAVVMLSNAAKGKANFFLADAFKNFTPSAPCQYENCICAIDIVEYDEKYKKLIAYLLDNVYVTSSDNIPKDQDVTFITQSGKLIRRKYSVSGGSVGLFEGKRIGRAKNIEKLDKEIKILQKSVSEIQALLNDRLKLKEKLSVESFKGQIEKLRQEVSLLEQNKASFSTRLEQVQTFISSAEHKKEEIQNRIAELEEDISTNTPQAQVLEAQIKVLQEQLEQYSEDLTIRTEQFNRSSTAFNQENLLFHQLSNKVKSLEQEISYKQNTFDANKERITRNQEELKKVEEDIKTLLDNADISDDKLIELYKEKEEIEKGVTEAEKDYYLTRGNTDLLEKEIRNLSQQRENCDALIMELNNKINENKLNLAAVTERLSVEFGVKVDALEHEDENSQPTTQNPQLNEDDLKQKVEKIRKDLDVIGPVNPMAMEAYNEVAERNKFIREQKQDLLNAKNSLLATIKEIDVTAKDAFLDAFYKIKDNFKMVFRSLFTEEDTCDLVLLNPDDPTESAIDITAKPKGKRPLSINQLSGGEKTLTAISLLFAIYLIKPAPFCIFDEVDAPLDDANIDKFNNIIKKFSGDSQFILVTHNKRTMTFADIIYGITMIEQGVSRVVPVDLRALA
ncbi:MAG: chromosome segregation protein SMC [Opitutaceae bacterium]|nr:chromosome segregation protein SMC [Cytophagales bacterium]